MGVVFSLSTFVISFSEATKTPLPPRKKPFIRRTRRSKVNIVITYF